MCLGTPDRAIPGYLMPPLRQIANGADDLAPSDAAPPHLKGRLPADENPLGRRGLLTPRRLHNLNLRVGQAVQFVDQLVDLPIGGVDLTLEECLLLRRLGGGELLV